MKETSPHSNTIPNTAQPTNATPPPPSRKTTPTPPPQQTPNPWQEKYTRLYAEFENTKKRLRRDKLQWHRMANKDLILELLPTLDNLTRALNNLQANPTLQPDTTQGLHLILDNLHKTLHDQGLRPIDVQVGHEPNPHHHHILSQAPAPNPTLKGKIINIITPGYLLHSHVIRPAQVIIGS